jgi:hypothetical protein
MTPKMSAMDAIRDDCHYRLRIHDHNGFRVFSLRYHEDPDSDRFDTAITVTLARATIADATFDIADVTLARMLRYIAEVREEAQP